MILIFLKNIQTKTKWEARSFKEYTKPKANGKQEVINVFENGIFPKKKREMTYNYFRSHS